MNRSTQPLIVCDVANTFGYVVCRDAAPVTCLRPFGGVADALARLSTRARLKWMPSDGQATDEVRALLDSAGLGSVFTPVTDAQPPRVTRTHFHAARQTPLDIFISGDAARRMLAAAEGFRVAPHIALADPMLDGDDVFYVRISGSDIPRDLLIADPPLVVLHDADREDAAVLYGIATTRVRRRLMEAGLRVEMISEAGLLERANLFYFGKTAPPEAGEAFLQRVEEIAEFVDRYEHEAVFALPTPCTVASLSPPLSCNTVLVELPPILPRAAAAYPTYGAYSLSQADRDGLAALTEALYGQYLDPWWGGSGTLPGTNLRVKSRHVLHPHNREAVNALFRVLHDLGCAHVEKECFAGENGLRAENVVAEIPGHLSGEVVILSAHLDSLSNGGDPASDCAPGVNDDASGMAGVLAAAAVFRGMGTPRRTIRLVLFNAEENGRLGSEQYACAHASDARRIVAAFQLDMIGRYAGPYPPGYCEVHTGNESRVYKDVHKESFRLGTIVQQAARELFGDQFGVEPYPSLQCPVDAAGPFSDHGRLAARGIPACLICEELYPGCAGGISKNTNYHSPYDREIDRAYAADVARIAAAAVWIRANAP